MSDMPRPRLLIVDDSTASIEMLNEALSAQYDVFFAITAAEGIALAAKTIPDIILLDVLLPDRSGYEVCRELKLLPDTRSIPIIFQTANAHPSDKAMAFQLGAADYLVKPYYFSELKARIASHLVVDADTMKAASTKHEAPDFPPEPARQKILITDDNPANIEILNEILSDTADILFAMTGSEAVILAEREQPDLILLDVMLPDYSGYEVCEHLKKNEDTQHIPVIFVTALETEADETRGFEVGAIDYISKPFRAGIVRARVRNHLELARHQKMLQQLSLTDGLTGIANRRHFNELLDKEWSRAQRHERPLTLMMIDVDRFKPYNDYYGHGEGDLCLRHVAQTIAGVCRRKTDSVARIGGEEFAVLLPDANIRDARDLADDILQSVRALLIKHKHNQPTGVVTVSLGMACSNQKGIVEPGQLLQWADANLYRAKTQGRNRICCDDPVAE